MAQEVFEKKFPQPTPIAPRANGAAGASRVPAGKPEKRRSSAWLWIVLVLLFLAAIAAGVYFFQHKAQSTAATAKAGDTAERVTRYAS